MKIGKLNPFLLKIPYVPIPKADLPRFTSFTQEGKQIYPIYSSDKLSILALGFLTDISLYPESRITERYKRLGMNPKTGNNLKKALLERSLIKERRVYNGRNVVLLDLTPSGALSLEQNPRKGWRKGNSEHQYWRYRAANHYRELGYEVEEEVAVGEGRSVDVIAKKGKESLGIQIETGSSDIGRNVETCLDAGCSKVFLIPTNQEAKKTVVEVVKEWYPAPVSLMTTRFLKTLRDIV